MLSAISCLQFIKALSFIIQIWSYELERRASRALRCGRPLPRTEGYYGLNINIKSNANSNFSELVLSWYNELDQYYFSPEDGSCWPSYRMCLNAYTVSDLMRSSVTPVLPIISPKKLYVALNYGLPNAKNIRQY